MDYLSIHFHEMNLHLTGINSLSFGNLEKSVQSFMYFYLQKLHLSHYYNNSVNQYQII